MRYTATLIVCLLTVTPALSLAIPAHVATSPDPIHPEGRSAADGGRAGTGPSISYAIVTPDQWVDLLKPLADWKTKKGVAAKVFGLNAIYSTYPGNDSAERLHNFLVQLKRDNKSLKWLLLVGDGDDDNPTIPVRYIYTNGSAIDSFVRDNTPTDIYYAGLDHNWDQDGDLIYGENAAGPGHPDETDLTFDLYPGRWPVKTNAQVTNLVNRVLTYEKNPPTGDWMRSALLVGGLMDTPNVIGNDSTVLLNGYYEEWQDNGYEAVQKASPSFPAGITKTVLADYPQIPGGAYTPVNDNYYEARVVQEFNKGYALVGTATHGWISGNGMTNYIGTGTDYNFDSGYYWTDARDATNGNRLPLIYSSGCNVGDFTTTIHPNWGNDNRDHTFEQLLQNPGGGAIGLIAPADGTYRGEENRTMSVGNWYIFAKFWETFFSGKYSPGETLFLTKSAYLQHLRANNLNSGLAYFKQDMVSYNLMGDPEVPVWTDIPSTLDVTYPGTIYSVAHTVQVTVKNSVSGAPVAGAMVAITNPDGSVYSVAVTNMSGGALLPVAPQATGTLDITVTAHNYLPFENTLSVAVQPADLMIAAENITFAGDVLRAGVVTTVTARIVNAGQTASGQVFVSFYDGDPGAGDMIGSALPLSPVQPGRNATLGALWTPPEGSHEVWVVVDAAAQTADYDRGNNRASKGVFSSGTDLSVSAINITGAAYLPNGTMSVPFAQGGGIQVNVTLALTGTPPAADVHVRLYNGTPPPLGNGTRLGTTDLRVAWNGSTGVVSLSWSPPAAGWYSIYTEVDVLKRVTEYDEGNNLLTRDAWFNALPLFRTLPTVDVEEGKGAADLDLAPFVTDADTPAADLRYSVAEPPTEPKVKAYIIGSILSVRSEDYFSGPASLVVEVTDGTGRARQTVPVSVHHVNHAPALDTVGDLYAAEDKPFSVRVTARDGDGDALTFRVEPALLKVSAVNSTGTVQSALLTFTPARKDVGVQKLKLTVSDGSLSVTQEFTITVNRTDRKPSLGLTPGTVLTATEGKRFTLVINATDPDGDDLTFSDDSPLFEIVKISSTSARIEFTPAKAQAGTYTINITVFGGTLNDTRSITLKVEPAKVEKVNGTIGGVSPLLIVLPLVVLLIAAAAGGVLLLRRRRREPEEEKGGLYDRNREKENYQRIQREMGMAPPEEPEPQAEAPQAETDSTAPAIEAAQPAPVPAPAPSEPAKPKVKCPNPKCGSDKVEMYPDGGGICLRCGKIIK